MRLASTAIRVHSVSPVCLLQFRGVSVTLYTDSVHGKYREGIDFDHHVAYHTPCPAAIRDSRGNAHARPQASEHNKYSVLSVWARMNSRPSSKPELCSKAKQELSAYANSVGD